MLDIIIPVYKVEQYLRECVDSVLAHEGDVFEVVLVDDGSPDNSGKICDEYAEKYYESPNSFEVITYDELGNKNISLTADYGISYQEKKIMEAKRNVVITNFYASNTHDMRVDAVPITYDNVVTYDSTRLNEIIVANNSIGSNSCECTNHNGLAKFHI